MTKRRRNETRRRRASAADGRTGDHHQAQSHGTATVRAAPGGFRSPGGRAGVAPGPARRLRGVASRRARVRAAFERAHVRWALEQASSGRASVRARFGNTGALTGGAVRGNRINDECLTEWDRPAGSGEGGG